MAKSPGLRERKKQQTRLRISRTALDLFAERGFDRVPVSEIAERAEVSQATVFNYFTRKEDLIYQGMEDYGAELADQIRNRPAGVSVLDAFADFALQARGALTDDDPDGMAQIALVAQLIADSPTLQARERQIADQSTRALAELIAEELGIDAHDSEAWVAASALMAVTRAMTAAVHRHALQGRRGTEAAEDVLNEGQRALRLVEHGLADRLTRARPRTSSGK